MRMNVELMLTRFIQDLRCDSTNWQELATYCYGVVLFVVFEPSC